MVKLSVLLIIFVLSSINVFGQPKTGASAAGKTNLQALVETEIAFAATAAEKGTKAAFLSFLDDDGIIFEPIAANGKLIWRGRPESPSRLAWKPVWADISSNGALGYTTGGWEFLPNGKNGEPTAFGEYVTIWKKHSDGTFKAVLDIGIKHPQTTVSNDAWKSPSDGGSGDKSVKRGIDQGVLTDIFSKGKLSVGYFNYLADDVVVLREGYAPFAGKQAAFLGLEKTDKEFPPKSFLNFDAQMSGKFGNMMYAWGVYKLTHEDKTVSRWNFVQIWKYRANRWQIVLDIFNKIETEKK